jgi:ubiquitin-protein ligase
MIPPKIHFLTKIYHPNVDRVGRICLDILKENWSPALLVDRVCLSLQQLLGSPNADDPLDATIAKAFRDTPQRALIEAANWTRMYASQQPAKAQPSNRGPIPRSFQLRMELEKAEKDRENKSVQSPHAGFVSVGLGTVSDVGYARQLEEWTATIIGVPRTRTDGRIYNLSIKCGANYPQEPPLIKFVDKISMPGIDERGNVAPQMFQWNTQQLPGMLGAMCQIRQAMSAVNTPQPPEGATY